MGSIPRQSRDLGRPAPTASADSASSKNTLDIFGQTTVIPLAAGNGQGRAYGAIFGGTGGGRLFARFAVAAARGGGSVMPETSGFSLGDISLWTLVLVALVSYASSVVGGLAGTGVGLLMMPMLVPVVGIRAVVPVISVAMLLGSSSRLWVFRHDVQWRISRNVMLGSVPGVILGASIYGLLPANVLYAVLGGFLVLSVPARRIFARRNRVLRAGGVGTAAMGFGYGIISGIASGGGPILVAMLLGMGLKGAAVIGTKAGVSIVMHSVKAATFGLYGLLDVELVLAAILIGACTLPGAYTAKWLVDRMHLQLHTAIIEVAVFIGGLSLLWRLFD